jgi:hypothetical protein
MIWWNVAKWAAIGAAILFIVQMIRNDGAQSVKNKIERQNNEAAQNADIARLDFDDCVGNDKLWNFASGRCEWAP